MEVQVNKSPYDYIEELSKAELMVATGCSWRRILTESGKSVFVPRLRLENGDADIEAKDVVFHLFSNAPHLVLALSVLKQVVEKSLISGLSVELQQAIGFANSVLVRSACGVVEIEFNVEHLKSYLYAEIGENQISALVMAGVLSPYRYARSGQGLGRHIKDTNGQIICCADYHYYDGHPDLRCLPGMLNLFRMSAVLHQNLVCLTQKASYLITGLSVQEMDEVLLMCEKSLKSVIGGY